MQSVIQGIILGFIMVLPGMSGGTAFLILGIFEDMIKDLAKLNIKPYLPLFGGTIIGIFAGGNLFALVFQSFRDQTAAFLMGCLIASIRMILMSCLKININRLLVLLVGLIIGFYLGGEPFSLTTVNENVSWTLLLVGGALASVAMIIPGIPGSAVLIALGIYDSILFYIKELEILNLIIFGIGSILGIVLFVKLLSKIYEKYQNIISYFFVGLILGSSRTLLPYSINLSIILIFAIGFGLVWLWSGKKDYKTDKLREDGA